MSESTESADQEQSLTEHLTELRTSLIQSGYGIILGFILCFWKSDLLFAIIRRPIAPFLEGKGLVFTAPMEQFLAHVKVSLLGGLVLSCPWWVYQIWRFIAPGLYSSEKRYALGFIFSGTFLFLSGISFVYFVVYPMAFDFLINYGGGADQAMITISDYLSFFATTTIVFGLAFELPLILTLLGIAGVIDKEFLVSKRKYAIIVLAVLSAFITPPDAISMVLLMIPLYLLYELGVLLVGFFGQTSDQAQSNKID